MSSLQPISSWRVEKGFCAEDVIEVTVAALDLQSAQPG